MTDKCVMCGGPTEFCQICGNKNSYARTAESKPTEISLQYTPVLNENIVKSEFVFRPKEEVLIAEYRSCSPVKFANMKMTIYDSEGKEIPVPECKICKKQMSMIMGKEAIGWYCYEHGSLLNE